jgi:IS5 family transposase
VKFGVRDLHLLLLSICEFVVKLTTLFLWVYRENVWHFGSKQRLGEVWMLHHGVQNLPFP